MLLEHSSINRVLKGFPVLVEVDFKDAARLGELNCEGFLAFVEGEYTQLGSAAACCLWSHYIAYRNRRTLA